MRLGERERVEERASYYYVKGRRESERERKGVLQTKMEEGLFHRWKNN